jgi:hypothetical protein
MSPNRKYFYGVFSREKEITTPKSVAYLRFIPVVGPNFALDQKLRTTAPAYSQYQCFIKREQV